MSIHSSLMPEQVRHYLTEVIARESPVARRLREETMKLPCAQMMTAPDQVAFLALMIRLTKAKHVIEVGTFTGYGSLAMAEALPQDGRLIACDVSEKYTSVAKRYWAEANVAELIDLRLAPAEDTLSGLLAEGRKDSFDFIFIDADKARYDRYYELSLKLLKTGGIIAFDNMLWDGAVADDSDQDGQTKALRALNIKLRDDARVDTCLLSLGDGVALALKR